MIPLAHDFTDETVLVVGGGSVGARKARRFAREARVVVVSPSFADADFGGDLDRSSGAPADDGDADDGDAETSDPDAAVDPDAAADPDAIADPDATADSDTGHVELVRAAPGPDDVADWIARTDPALVVAATDEDAVNEAATAAAREHGALVNRADRAGDRDVDDVAVPATVREDPVVVAISTGGTSPALARVLRERVESELASAGEMAVLTADLRERLRAADVDPAARRDAVRAVARSSRLWTGLRAADSNVEQITEDVVADVLEDRQ